MNIEILVAGLRLRTWHTQLGARLGVGPGARVALRLTDGPPLPSALELLLSLEQLVHRRPAARLAALAQANGAITAAAEDVDVAIDLAGEAPPKTARRALRVLYDGVPDEAAIFAALLDRRVPVIEVEDVATGATVARGVPSTENAGSIGEAYEEVVARTANVLAAAVRHPSFDMNAAPPGAGAIAGKAVARYAARSLAFKAARQLYHLCCRAPHWRVGWRMVADGDVWDTQSLGGPAWGNLPDPSLRFYADPFPIVRDGELTVFVEDFDHRTQKACISAVHFGDHGPVGPVFPVLQEPWHLSYPFLIEDDGEVWMIPESSQDRTVRLYRADPFPHRWVQEAVLLEGMEASDATVVRHAGQFWMLAATRDGVGSYSDMLSIFMADRLLGPWQPHPGNPVLIDAASARPAGAMLHRNGRLWRPVQDCRRGYGTGLGLAEVTRLDREGFAQKVHTTLRPGPEWPGRKLHTLNRAGPLEVIDGSGVSLRLPAALSGARDLM
jgi:hypothetical protein